MGWNNFVSDVICIYKKNKDIENGNLKHNAIQNEVCLLSHKYNYTFKKEHYQRNLLEASRRSKIDVVWHKENSPSVAIEIDSSARPKSIHKLLEFNGKKVWIYYGIKIDKVKKLLKELDVDSEIQMIYIKDNI